MMFCISMHLPAQVGINSNNSAPDPSAMLDVKSTTKGLLPPRMNSAQRDAVVSPAAGLLIFNTDCNDVQLFNGAGWIPIGNSGAAAAPGSISGIATPCSNAVGIIYSIPAFSGAVGYKWTVPDGATITGGQGTTAITVNFGTTSGSVSVSAYGNCWRSLSAYLGITISPGIETPHVDINVPSETQIVWNWSYTYTADGYKFNTVNDFNTAEDLGYYGNTKTETGLTCNTLYTRYVWAYSAFGLCPSMPLVLTQSTTVCCGSSFTINHMVSDGVAPVNKTVTYGTVTNIAGEPSKCWITSNLGANHQATAKDDSTEASAGWYWQFNRSQGYKHNGTNRTPNSTWISSISESSDWTTANDPCALVFGNGWRIPTNTEWTNVDGASGGNWINWNGPWNSDLKLHAAGFLYKTNGGLTNRGTYGYYWSSKHYDDTGGWYLSFYSTNSFLDHAMKASAMPLRCIREE